MKPQLATQFDAFLSYSHEDATAVREIQEKLETSQVTVWRDAGQILPGDLWMAKIEAGLRQSRYVVLFSSVHALRSDWVQREWNAALTLNMPIIPVRLDDAEVPLLLQPNEFIDARAPLKIDATVESIVAGIQGGHKAPSQRMEPTDQQRSNPSALGPDVELLHRMIQNQVNGMRPLEPLRGSAAAAMLFAAGVAIWSGRAADLWTAAVGIAVFVVAGSIATTLTAQLRWYRTEVLTLTSIKDGIELYCPKQPSCVHFRSELENILLKRARIGESHR